MMYDFEWKEENVMERAIITGASGMLGQALCRLLAGKGIQVYAVVRPDSQQNAFMLRDERVTAVACDLTELAKLPEKIGESCDAFFHFGWGGTYGGNRNNYYGQWENVRYTLDAVQAASELGCSVFLGAGSQAEFGRVPDGVKLSSAVCANPETGYGIAKLSAGQMSRAFCRDCGIRHVWTRILSVYGPGDKDRTMVMSGICSMLRGEMPKYTKGEQIWDYLYCDDAAMAFYLAAEKGRDGAVYTVGSGQERRLRDYIQDICDVICPGRDIVFGEVPYYDKQVMYLCADIRELQEDTGFAPSVPFSEGIRRTVEWRQNMKY